MFTQVDLAERSFLVTCLAATLIAASLHSSAPTPTSFIPYLISKDQ